MPGEDRERERERERERPSPPGNDSKRGVMARGARERGKGVVYRLYHIMYNIV